MGSLFCKQVTPVNQTYRLSPRSRKKLDSFDANRAATARTPQRPNAAENAVTLPHWMQTAPQFDDYRNRIASDRQMVCFVGVFVFAALTALRLCLLRYSNVLNQQRCRIKKQI